MSTVCVYPGTSSNLLIRGKGMSSRRQAGHVQDYMKELLEHKMGAEVEE